MKSICYNLERFCWSAAVKRIRGSVDFQLEYSLRKQLEFANLLNNILDPLLQH